MMFPTEAERRQRRRHFKALRAAGKTAVVDKDPWRHGLVTATERECLHLGTPTDKDHECGGCGGGLRTIWECKIHGETLPFYQATDFRSCMTCPDYVKMEATKEG